MTPCIFGYIFSGMQCLLLTCLLPFKSERNNM